MGVRVSRGWGKWVMGMVFIVRPWFPGSRGGVPYRLYRPIDPPYPPLFYTVILALRNLAFNVRAMPTMSVD